jgi:hypothetical protein
MEAQVSYMADMQAFRKAFCKEPAAFHRELYKVLYKAPDCTFRKKTKSRLAAVVDKRLIKRGGRLRLLIVE